jgi:hypothetical protein
MASSLPGGKAGSSAYASHRPGMHDAAMQSSPTGGSKPVSATNLLSLRPRRPSSAQEPLERRSPPPAELLALARQCMGIALGIAVASATTAAAAARSTMPEPPARREDDPSSAEEDSLPDVAAVLTGAALELTLEAGWWATWAVTQTRRTISPFLSWITAPTLVRRPLEEMFGLASRLNDRWQAANPEQQDAAAAFAQILIPQIADAIVGLLDPTQLVREHADLDRLAAELDVDAIVRRIDLPAIAQQVIDATTGSAHG